MRIVNNRWQINSRDIWHGINCLDHCLAVSLAVAAGEPAAVAKVEGYVESDGAKFRLAQGNEYEDMRFEELAANLGSDFVQLADFSDIEQTIGVAKVGVPVIAQATVSLTMASCDYNGRADLLVRSDYELAFTDEGTLTALPIEGAPKTGFYAVWEIKHASRFDSKGKENDSTNYRYQLAMNVAALGDMGITAAGEVGVLYKGQDMAKFNAVEIQAELNQASAQMMEYLETKAPQRLPELEVQNWRCAKPGLCDDARCDYKGICSAVRIEQDEISQLYRPNHHHTKALLENGFNTIEKMLSGNLSVTGVKAEYLEGYLRFARVISKSKETGKPEYEVFNAPKTCKVPLPERRAEDLFVDFEWYTPLNSREEFYYLFGVMTLDGSLKQHVAASDADEKTQFFAFVQQLEEAIAKDSSMHIYICSKAEVTKTKALAARYDLELDRLENLLGHFVDLQDVAANSVAVSTGSYGLKAMEQFFSKDKNTKRATATSDGESSLWQYHEYLARLAEGKDDEAKKIFDDIATYNGKDCQSTRDYYDWLATI